MDISRLSRFRFLNTIGWAVTVCVVVVAIAAALGRATLNLKAALTDKPDIGIYLLLPDEGITSIEVLRERPTERDYIVQTKEGPKFVKLKRGENRWYVSVIERMHE